MLGVALNTASFLPAFAEDCGAGGWKPNSSCNLKEESAGSGRSYLKNAVVSPAKTEETKNSSPKSLAKKAEGSSKEVTEAEPIEITPGKQIASSTPSNKSASKTEAIEKRETNAKPAATVTPTIVSDKETNGLNVTSLDKITVTATRTRKSSFEVPGMATIVTKDDAKTAGASDYKSLLADVPGVEFQGSARRNGQVPVIRGFDADSILILKDGVRQNFQSQHDGQFFVDTELLKQVEVVRGPSSTLYGSGGLGGVISFTTVDAADLLEAGQTMGAKVSGGFQSVNKEFLTSAAAFGRAGDFDVLGNLVYRDSGDIKLGDGSTLQSDDSVKSGLAKLAWKATPDQTVRASYEIYRNDSEEPNNPQTPAAVGTNVLAAKDSVSQTGRLAYEYKDAKAQVYNTVTDVTEKQLERSDQNRAGDVLERKLETTGINLDNQNRFMLANKVANTVSYGVEYYTNSQDGTDTGSASGNRGGVPDAESEFYGGYVQNEIVIDKVSITPGLRYDSYNSESDNGGSQDESAASPKVSIGYKPQPWLFLFGNYAHAFRAPNLTELYASGVHFNVGPFQNSFIENPDLEPEKSANLEAGIGLTFNDVVKKKDSWRLKLSGYRIDAEDFIDSKITPPSLSTACFLPGPRPPGTVCNGGSTQYVNIPEATINGVDIEGGYEDELIIFSLGYTTMTGHNDDTSEYLTNLIPNTLKTSLSFKFPEYKTVAGWRGQFVSEFDKVNSVTAIRDGYQVHDLFLEYKMRKNLALNFGVDNVFDEAYERIFAGSFEPGRNYKVKMSYKW